MNTIIDAALKRGQRALSEYQSKKFLAAYGIPVTKEELTHSPEEAAAMAKRIGFPVAVKACGPDLMHKTEAGCIRLNIGTEQEAAAAYGQVVAAASVELEGVLIQEMVPGLRELVLGLTRDPQFGPCVMLGLGGVMAEIINDTVFRVAPFDAVEAEDMTRELRAKAVFEPFRGEPATDLAAVCRCLTALGEIGLAHSEIFEIDINPLKIDSSGKVKAVDALIVIKREK
jgi:acetate---CoA ligase (ADP-forming) subunit beta